MIYSFEKDDDSLREFLAVLADRKCDYEIIKKDKIVIRIFGRMTEDLQQRLDGIAGRIEKPLLSGRSSGDWADSGFPNGETMVIAGPCSVESEVQLDRTAEFLSSLGIRYLRGGAFKPRTRSDSFQGLGKTGLKILSSVAARYDMKIVTEAMDRSQLNDVADYADIIQVGSRNMFNYSLLTALGAVDQPVLLKRGMAATIDEWVQASMYIRRGGNERVILCERGIRTFESRTRFTLDILAIPLAQELSGLPVIADVSHAAGKRKLVPPLLKAALAAGADGIMVEVHPDPDQALSDGSQSMTFDDFRAVYEQVQETGLLKALSYNP